MEMPSLYMIILDFIIPIFFIVYGIRTKKDPPPMGSKNAIISTKRARKSDEAWKYAQSVAANVCIVAGLVMAAFCIVKYILNGTNRAGVMDIIYFVAEGLCIASLFIVVNIALKKKFGN